MIEPGCSRSQWGQVFLLASIISQTKSDTLLVNSCQVLHNIWYLRLACVLHPDKPPCSRQTVADPLSAEFMTMSSRLLRLAMVSRSSGVRLSFLLTDLAICWASFSTTCKSAVTLFFGGVQVLLFLCIFYNRLTHLVRTFSGVVEEEFLQPYSSTEFFKILLK